MDDLNWEECVKVFVSIKKVKPPKKREVDLFEEQLMTMKHTTRENLTNDLQTKKDNLESYEHKQKEALGPIEDAVKRIEISLRHLHNSVSKVKRRYAAEVNRRREEILKVESELDYFDKSYNLPETELGPSLRREFDCPVCYEVMEPPRRIYQCENGHLLCEHCKVREEMSKCPTCRLTFGAGKKLLSRNRAMEKLIENYVTV